MKYDQPLSQLPKEMAEAAFQGDVHEVLRVANAWLERFTGASYVIIGTAQSSSIDGDFRTGTTPDYAVHLDQLPVGRGTIYVDDHGGARVIYADDRRPSFAMPGRAEAHFLGLPVYADHEAVALIFVSRPAELGDYSWREQLCVCGHAAQLGQAIELAHSAGKPSILRVGEAEDFLQSTQESQAFLRFTKSDLDDAIEQARHHLSAVGHVDASHVYLPAPDGLLVPTNIWHADDAMRLRPFQLATERRVFTAGRGLPGRVLKTKLSSFIPDVQSDGNFPRAADAVHSGIHSAVAVPVRHDGRVAAVVECFFGGPVSESAPAVCESVEAALAI